jgi:hypothetical protein
VAKKELATTNTRNVFVDGTNDRYQKAKQLIDDIIKDHRRHQDQRMHIGESNPFPGPYCKVEIANKHAGLVIGRNGDTLRGICNRSGAYIFIPKESQGEWRVIQISGE